MTYLKPILQLLVVMCLFINMTEAQIIKRNFKGKNYEKRNNDWYRVSDKGADYCINNQVILKIANNKDIANLKKFEKVIGKFSLIESEYLKGYYLLTSESSSDLYQLLDSIEKTDFFEIVEPNVCFHESGMISQSVTATVPWHLEQINMNKAWGITKGSSGIRVGILDSGCDFNHPDLNDNTYTNPGLDYYFTFPDSIQKLGTDPSAHIINFHGTACAGVIGAEGNNTYGIKGIAVGNNGAGVDMVHVQVNQYISYSDQTWYSDWSVSNAIGKIIDNTGVYKVRVVSMSINGFSEIYYTSQMINNANSNIIFVASAGNYKWDFEHIPPIEESSLVLFPATLENVFAVGATSGTTDRRKALSPEPDSDDWGSCQGNALDFMAPGVNIWTTDPRGSFGKNTLGNDYMNNFLGTSSACPQVSGLVALILSINPNLSRSEVKTILINGCYYNSTYMTPALYGNGRIDAHKALKYTIENHGGTFDQDVIIPAGDTLTIQAGKTLKFAPGKKLIVNGTLNVNGTSTSGVTFNRSGTSGTWGGIVFNSGSGGSINYANITYATDGIKCNSEGNVTIDHCEISNCSNGIYGVGTNYDTVDPTITNCYLRNNSYGIKLENSSPDIRHNRIQSNTTGLYCYSNSSATLGHSGYYGENTISGNSSHGLYVYAYSHVFMGLDGSVNGGNNIVENNGLYGMYTWLYCNVVAEKNWWGSNPPTASSVYSMMGSTLDYTPYLTSRPSISYSMNLMKTGETSDESNTSEEIMEALKLFFTGNYNEAKQICESIIKKSPEEVEAFHALDLLWRIGKKTDINSYENYLDGLKQKKENLEIYGLAEIILAGFDETKQIADLDKIKEKYKGTFIEEFSYYAEFSKYFHKQNDYEKARTVLIKMEELFGETELVRNAKMLLGMAVGEINGDQLPKNESAEEEASVPNEFNLLGNYPNPFNPSTVIKFSIPVTSNIRLTIYNMMGQEVKTFESNSAQAGVQQFTWDGTNMNNERVASGVYIYRLHAVGVDGQTFDKSAKMTLLK